MSEHYPALSRSHHLMYAYRFESLTR